MKKILILFTIMLLPLLSSAQWADDIYYSADDAQREASIAKQKPAQTEAVYKNGARKIVYLDENTKYSKSKINTDSTVVLDSAEQLNYEYAQRIKRFHSNSASVIISDPSNDDVYYLDGNDWIVYDNNGYTSISQNYYGWNSWNYNSYYPWYSGWNYWWHRPYYTLGWYDPYWSFGWSGYYGWGYPYYGWGGYYGWDLYYGGGYYGWGNNYYYDYRPSGYYGSNRRNQYGTRAGIRSGILSNSRTGISSSRTREAAVGNYRTGVRLAGNETRTNSSTSRTQKDVNSSIGTTRNSNYATSGRRVSESGIRTTPRISNNRTTTESTVRRSGVATGRSTQSGTVRSNTYGGRTQSGAVRSSGSYSPSRSNNANRTYSAPSRSNGSYSAPSRSSGSYSGSSGSRSSGGSYGGGSRSSGGRR